jgi:hypothetical protein
VNFTDQERAIFPYHNGQSQVFADPLALQRKLNVLLQGDIGTVVKEAYTATVGDTGGAMQKLLDAIREAFSLSPVDPATGQGITDLMALSIFRQFGEFLSAKKI